MESLPKYTVYRTSRKSIRLSLRPNGKFAVYCPKRCPKKDIEEMVRKHYKGMLEKFNARPDALFVQTDGHETLPFLGKRYPLVTSENNKFYFDGERFISPTSDKEANRELYREFLRKQAKEIILPLTKEIAERFGFNYSGVNIKAIYSRYGSCSSKKHLNFALALAAFDIEFIKFVISHELCHTVHLNHSASFYALLDKVYPEHRKVKAEDSKERSLILKAIHYRHA